MRTAQQVLQGYTLIRVYPCKGIPYNVPRTDFYAVFLFLFFSEKRGQIPTSAAQQFGCIAVAKVVKNVWHDQRLFSE